MNSNGNVGIGIVPTSGDQLRVGGKLYVSSDTYINDVYPAAGMGSSTFYFSSLTLKTLVPWIPTSLGINMTPSSTYALDVNGFVRCTSGSWVSSDQIYKKNIESISGKTALEILLQVQGKTYEYKTRDELLALYQSGELKLHVDTISTIEYNEDNEEVIVEEVQIEVPHFLNGRSYGFIAQEVEGILPELVSFDSTLSTYSLNYEGFIPIMLEAIKEQQAEIEDLKQQIAISGSLKSAEISSISSGDLDIDQEPTTLFQNAPNPFSEGTKIKYYLEEQVGTATIFIYDMNGRQLRSNELHHKGSGEISINSGELDAGMYMYTLITDGQVVGTKQMILTD